MAVVTLRSSARIGQPHLEMEDARIAILEALPMGDHAVKEGVIQREGGNGGQEPAVTWTERERQPNQPGAEEETVTKENRWTLGRGWFSGSDVLLSSAHY